MRVLISRSQDQMGKACSCARVLASFGMNLAGELYLSSRNVIGGITIKYMFPITMVGRAGILPCGGIKVC